MSARNTVNSLVKILLFVTLLTTMNLVGNVAYAQDNKKPIDKSQAAQRAQQKVKGRVLKVDQNKGKYRVKVLQKSGRVVSVDVDKRSGKVSPKKKKKD
jgi:uncharacterized membrane protein YkoI